jgi:hypothetical protein
MADSTDRKRLSQVQATDLSESRINDDFVHWLKTSGLNYLLLVLVAIAAFMGLQAWKKKDQDKRQSAWAELGEATLPQALADIAERHAGVDSVSLVAWLSAGDAHLRELQTGMIGGGGQNPDGTPIVGEPLTAEQRSIALDAADRYYQTALDATKDRRNVPGMQPFVLSALFGKAAIAESRGDLATAKAALEDAAALAETTYPRYAGHAKVRLETLALLETPTRIPTKAELPVKAAPAAPAATSPSPTATSVEEELLQSLQEQLGAPITADPQPAPAEEPPAEPAPATP